MRLVDRISAVTARAMVLIAAAAVVIMTLHVAAGIISRTIFGVSLTGTVEIVSYYYMVFVAFAPWAFTQWLRDHIAVDALVGLMPYRLRVATAILAIFASLVVIALLTWALVDMAIRQTAFGEHVVSGVVDVPVWPARWITVAGVGAMIVVLIGQLLNPGKIAEEERRLHDPIDHEIKL